MEEILLPDNIKPALEWVNNRILQKVTPRRKHALAQSQFAAALTAWANKTGRGMVGTEWHFQVRPPGEISRTLVPDIAFLSFDSMPADELEETEIPRIAPDVVVEVRSPEDRDQDISEKIRVYLQAGTRVVFLVEPAKKIVNAVERARSKTFSNTETLTHRVLPGFSMPVRKLFELARQRK